MRAQPRVAGRQTDAGEERCKQHRRLEIVHESLLSNWPRLVRWQTQDQEGAQLRDELRSQAQLWAQHGRTVDYLWTGAAYLDYLAWRERYPGGLTAIEEEFARSMTSFAERRRRRRRMAAAVAFVVLLIGLGVIGGFWRRSVAETRRAEASELVALAQVRLEDDPTEAVAYTEASLELADSEQARDIVLRLRWGAPPAIEVDGGDMGMWAPSFSPNGNRLAAIGVSDKARVWKAEGGPPVVLGGHAMTAASPQALWASNELLVTGIWEGREVHLWEFPAGDRVRTIEFGATTYWGVGADLLLAEISETDSATGHRILHLRSWRLPDGTAKDLGWVDETALGRSPWQWFDPDGSGWIYGLGSEIFYRPLPIRQGVPDRLIGSHENEAGFVGLPRDANRLWTVDDTGSQLWLWDLSSSTGKPLQIVERPAGLEEGAFEPPDPSGRWVIENLNLNSSRHARIWDLDAWPEARHLNLKRGGSWFAPLSAFHPSGDWVAVSTHGRTRLTLWPLRGARPRVVDGYSKRFWRPLEFSPDGRWLATVWTSDDSVRVWPLPGSGTREVRTLPLPPEAKGKLYRDLVFDPQGRFLIVLSYFDLAYLVPLDGSPPRRLQGSEGAFDDSAVSDAAISPSGRWLVWAYRWAPEGQGQKTLQVWDLETYEVRHLDLPEICSDRVAGTEFGIADLAFVDESTLYTSGAGGIHRWNLDTGTHELVLAARPGSCEMWAAFDPGALKALVLEPMPAEEFVGPARILDLATGEVQAFTELAETTLRNPKLWPRNGFYISGTIAATGDTEGIIRVARLSGGEPHLLLGHEGTVDYVAISPDGSWIASTGEDNTLRLWPMPDLDKPPLHTLPREQLIAKLKSLTNIRVVRDPGSTEGWTVTLDPFPGWEEVPTW